MKIKPAPILAFIQNSDARWTRAPDRDTDARGTAPPCSPRPEPLLFQESQFAFCLCHHTALRFPSASERPNVTEQSHFHKQQSPASIQIS